MIFASLAAMVLASSPAVLAESWSGEFHIRISGKGKLKGKGYEQGEWLIDREAKGTITVDRKIAGGAIAGTPDTNNTDRYESWISNSKLPYQIRVNDKILVVGPLFNPNNIRRDTWMYQTPIEKSQLWQEGKVGSSTLQLDLKESKFVFESPRFEATTRKYFQREFIIGPKSWTSRKPLLEDKSELGFEIIHGLNQPKEWFRISGAFKAGQKEIVLTRRFPFTVPLASTFPGQKLDAELKLVLKKTL